MMMRRVTMVAARRSAPLQARFIQVKKPDFENKFSIAQGASTKQNQHMAQILAGNLKWVDEMKSKDEEFFDKLAQPQKPRYLYFGCADSRVPANEILGLR